ncbi:MAG: uracil-DNA glycosylase, partial [Pseudomonadota bacterium]
LGRISHQSVVAALGQKQSAYVFGHASEHQISGLTLIDSYHCSRYNTNTGRLTEAMFHDVFALARARLDGARPLD